MRPRARAPLVNLRARAPRAVFVRAGGAWNLDRKNETRRNVPQGVQTRAVLMQAVLVSAQHADV